MGDFMTGATRATVPAPTRSVAYAGPPLVVVGDWAFPPNLSATAPGHNVFGCERTIFGRVPFGGNLRVGG